MAKDRFFTVPDDLHRPLDAALMEVFGCQCQHDLDGHIFPAAKRPADRRVNHPDPVKRQVKGMGDLFLVFMGPLPGD